MVEWKDKIQFETSYYNSDPKHGQGAMKREQGADFIFSTQ